MRRIVLILVAVGLAIPAAIWSLPKTSQVQRDSQELDELEAEAGRVAFKKETIRERYASLVAAARQNPPDQWLREFELTDQGGKKLRSQDLRGEPYIASFFFTTCPSVCVLQNDQVRLLQERFRDKPVRFVSISVDPEVDTPEVLTQYAKRVGAIPGRWFFLTGDFEYIQRVSSDMFFHALPQVRYHQEKFYLVDADGTLVGGYDWTEPQQLKELEEHLQELLAKTPNA